ncbi:MAG: KOW domain-containing RNA-binding protein [Clostridia bacterium]|nr:KOW domain-containing RNA-binding protein [Clostridia bacterium]
MLEKGSVVLSLAGRDKGRPLAVMESIGKEVSVCDGKERSIDRPKKKNIRHVMNTGVQLGAEELRSDKALRRALRRKINGNT